MTKKVNTYGLNFISHYGPYNIDGAVRLENPPLWVWAIIVGAIIAGKFIYRWQSARYFAKEAEGGKRAAEEELIVMMIKQKIYRIKSLWQY